MLCSDFVIFVAPPAFHSYVSHLINSRCTRTLEKVVLISGLKPPCTKVLIAVKPLNSKERKNRLLLQGTALFLIFQCLIKQKKKHPV